VALVATLVRWHLLLAETATTRDPDDPATVEHVVQRIPDVEALDLLTALTQADARAASPKAWSRWRAGLVLDLSRRVRARLEGHAAPPALSADRIDLPDDLGEAQVWVQAEPVPDGCQLTVVAPDRVGLLADVAATLALARVPVRAARAWAQDNRGVSVWEVADEHVDVAVLRQRYLAVQEGRIDPAARLHPSTGDELAPSVVVRAEASSRSTVLEVRAADRPGVLFRVCRALAGLDIAVRSAHVDTLGPQAVDVFYLQEVSAGVLSDRRSADAAHAVRAALSPPPAP
jgi:[protein-PII] uridylyltransferase